MPFSDQIRIELCNETGAYCANPNCQAPTGWLFPGIARPVGDGAHIVAQSSNGPRGDSPLTSVERGMASNGVWLCPNCHRKVDLVSPHDYSVELLKKWKTGARNWWQQHQGLSPRGCSWPDSRPVAARVSPDSLRGAKNFLQLHAPLIQALWQLRQKSPLPFERGVCISKEDEKQIRRFSSRLQVGKSWRNEWSTTFYCDDTELLNHMRKLHEYVDNMQDERRPYILSDRRVNFQQPDALCQAITSYITAWEALDHCIGQHDSWGL